MAGHDITEKDDVGYGTEDPDRIDQQFGSKQSANPQKRRRGLIIRSIFPTILLLVLYFWPALVASLPFEASETALLVAHRLLGVLIFFSGANVASHAVRHYFWNGWVASQTGTPVPKLLVDLSTFAMWVVALVLVLAFVFHVEVSAFLTTSGILIAVVGFALRNMISDVFTGIALGVEQPFTMDDWIELEDGTLGRVVEVNWRATKMITKEEVAIVIPNSFLATHPFKNFNFPEDFWRDAINIVLDYDVKYHQAERILLSAVNQVLESASLPRRPAVRIMGYTERGVEYELRYWVPNHADQAAVREKVMRVILRNLSYAGIKVPRNKIDFLNASDPIALRNEAQEQIDFLRGVGLFRGLGTPELDAIRNAMAERLYLQGEAIVTEGAAGETLFLVKEGYLDVSIKNPGAQNDDDPQYLTVGHLVPGMFFGEMSLLTGAPRAATVVPSVDAVVYEISKEDIRPMMEERPGAVRMLSEALAERQLANDRSTKKRTGAVEERERQRIADGLFGKIQNFFGHHGGEARPHPKPGRAKKASVEKGPTSTPGSSSSGSGAGGSGINSAPPPKIGAGDD